MKLTAFKYGVTEITERMAFQDGDEKTKLTVALLFFLIEHKEKKILVDVGCDTMPGFELKEFQKPVDVLESYGINRKEITDIVITHSHHDHIDALQYYPQAEVFIHRNELPYAESYLVNSLKVNVIDGDKTISEGVEFKHIGGHSEGSGIVLIETKEKTYVLCGDECYTKENLLKMKPTGNSCCLEKSTLFVKEYRNKMYFPILFHDPELVPEIGYKTIFECN